MDAPKVPFEPAETGVNRPQTGGSDMGNTSGAPDSQAQAADTGRKSGEIHVKVVPAQEHVDAILARIRSGEIPPRGT
jgi:hypothetical protein